MNTPQDPVLARRARAARLAALGRNVGFACFGLAMVVFLVGIVVDFNRLVANTVTALLVIGSVVFVPAVIAGYGVKAAEREDREQGLDHR